MSDEKETRERVRALVKQVLESVPLEEEKENLPERVVVNSLKDSVDKQFDRDESAKSLLTEDDLRGLEIGAKLRVAENVKFTSLAEDIIKDKNIELIKKSSRGGSIKIKSVAVSNKQADVGIIIDGAGIGSAMTANKVPNVRAAACYSPALAKNSRQHNGANVLTLGSGQNSFDEIKQIVEAFLSTDLTEDRHIKRVGKISAIEQQYKR